jgi:phosphate-selective porin OprO/OprP
MGQPVGVAVRDRSDVQPTAIMRLHLAAALALLGSASASAAEDVPVVPPPMVLFEAADGSMTILNRVQFRWTLEMPDDLLRLPGTENPGDSRGSFRIRRAKTELAGWVFDRDLTYELQLSWAGPEPGASTTSALEDFLLTWDVSGRKAFQVTVGQLKVPLGRQELTSSHRLQFADRDLLSFEFTRGRDVGVQLHGLLAGGKVEYRAGMFNGNPASRITNDNDKYQFNARVMLQPWGSVGYSEGDFESSGRPLLAVAAQMEKNDLNGATSGDDLDTRIFGGDAAIKWRGFSAFAEYFARHREPETAPPFDSDGFHAQAGYFIVRHKLEAAARYARYDPSDLVDANDRTEKGGALSYYIRKHGLKLQADFRQLEDEARGTSSNRELRVQTQVVF